LIAPSGYEPLLLRSLIEPDFEPPKCAPVDGKITLKGVSNSGVLIRVYVDDILVATLPGMDNPTGSWSVLIPITPGSHVIRVEDESGDSVAKSVEIPTVCIEVVPVEIPVEIPVAIEPVVVGLVN